METWSMKLHGHADLIDAFEAAEIVGCDYSTIHRRMWAGDLKGVHMGGGRHRLYRESVLEFKKHLDELRAERGEREPGRRPFYPRRKRTRDAA